MQPSSLLLPNGRFSQRLLADDLTIIKNLYQANGFLDVKVTADLQDDYQGKQERDGGRDQDRGRPADAGEIVEVGR